MFINSLGRKCAVRALQRTYYTCRCDGGKKCKNRQRNRTAGQVIAKTCEHCSFWEQEIAKCQGKPWKLKGMDRSLVKASPVSSKPVPSLKECAKRFPPKCRGEVFDFCEYKNVPDIPQATWDSHKEQN